MAFTVTMPKLSPTMQEGTIVKWCVKEGDFVQSGQVLIEVATDKATVEHAALDEGWLRKILIPENHEAIINQPIAIFTEEKDENIESYKPEGEMPPSPPEEQAEEKPKAEEKKEESAPAGAMQQPSFTPEKPLETYFFPFPTEGGQKRFFASPLAKKIAKEKGLDLATIKGSGPRGRILKADLEKAQPTGPISFNRREVPSDAPGSYEEQKLSPMRKVIARRLQESKTFVPHFYVQQQIDAEPLVSFREQLRSYGLKVTYNDCVVRACALALREHPKINSGFNSVNQTIIFFKTIDVAVAAETPAGLITPILRHTDYKNLGEISLEIRALVRRAKEGKLQEHEYKGGSFTVSNLGMYGITDFQAIINPPQAAILAVGGILDVPVIKASQIVPGKIMNLTLSVDHRVIDGVAAAEFIRTLKKYLENPIALTM